ncbi:MAG: trypsin-like serine protease [Candidatus Binatia bacterium]
MRGHTRRAREGRAGRIVASVAVAAALLLARTAGAQPDTARIVNGALTGEFPAAGALLVGNDPATATAWCSGVLIGCQTFLTAAHCVCDTSGSRCQGAGAPSPAGRLVFLQHAGFFHVARIRVHPDFRFPVGDVAVVTLTTPVTGVTPLPLAPTAPDVGQVMTTVGFGRTSGTRRDYGLKRAGDVTRTHCTDGVSDATSVCWEFTGTGADTCHGDSGGPLLVETNAGLAVAGVTSGGTSDDCTPDDLAYDASIAPYRTWIAQVAGADLGAHACGAVPPVGGADTTAVPLAGTLSAAHVVEAHEIVVAPGTRALRVTLNGTDDGVADVDLLVKAGGTASPADYDCRAAGGSPYGGCEFVAPVAGPWSLVVRRTAGSPAYQLTATLIGGAPPVCGNGLLDVGEECDGTDAGACPEACTTACTCAEQCRPGDLALTGVHLGRHVRLRAALRNPTGLYDALDPRGADFRLTLGGAATPVRITIPAGDAGWAHSNARRGVYRWRGRIGGLRRIVLRDRSAARGGWEITVWGRDVPGTRDLPPSTVSVTLSFGGTCVGA